MRRHLRTLALTVLAGLCAVACSATAPTRHGNAVAVPRGGIVRAAIYDDASHLWNPQQEYGTHTWEVFRCCLLRTLLSYNGMPSEQGGSDLSPDLASAQPTVSADGLTWTFTLKRGIHYAPPLQHVEVTSRDIARALLREANPKLNADGYSVYYSVIEGFDAATAQGDAATSISGLRTPDDHTLVVRVTRPTGDLGNRFSLPATAPIPASPTNPGASLGVATGHDEDYGRFLVATGPYMFKGSEALDFTKPAPEQQPVTGYVPRTSIELVRNPSWNAATDNLRKAYPDGFHIEVNGDGDAVYKSIDAGQLDAAISLAPPPDFLKRYLADPVLSRSVRSNPNDGIDFFAFNLAEAPFDDLHIRKAVNLAIDKATIRKTRGGPAAGAIGTHVIVDSMEDGQLADYDPYRTPDQAGSIDGAKEEIKLSRYDANRDGICDAAPCAHVATVTLKESPSPEVAALVAKNLQPLGIQLDVAAISQEEAPSERCRDLSKHTAFCMVAGWSKDYPDAVTVAAPLFSSASLYPNCCNFPQLGATPDQLAKSQDTVASVPTIDDRIDACLPKTGPDRVNCWVALDRYLMEDVVPIVPVGFSSSIEYTGPRISNYSFDQFVGVGALDHMAIATTTR